MTFEKLHELMIIHKIPPNVILQSDSGWECCETEMNGVWYNRSQNIIVFTQNGATYDSPYAREDDWQLIHSDLEPGRHGYIHHKPGCITRNVWGALEYGAKLCENCSATYESKAFCNAVEKKIFRVDNDGEVYND